VPVLNRLGVPVTLKIDRSAVALLTVATASRCYYRVQSVSLPLADTVFVNCPVTEGFERQRGRRQVLVASVPVTIT